MSGDPHAEVFRVLAALRGALDRVAVRGLGAAGPGDLAELSALRDDLDRLGAAHLSGRLSRLLDTIKAGDRGAARAWTSARAALRVFERVVTLEAVADSLKEPHAK